MKKILLAAVLVLCVAGCAAVQAPPSGDNNATGTSALMLKMSLAELVNESDWIVTGSVAGQESRWDAGHSSIITLVTVNVSRWIKGISPDGKGTVIITVPGGRVGSEAQVVEDVAGFSNGEQVLIFLKGGNDGAMEVAGGFQGKYTITGADAVPFDPQEKLKLDELVAQIKAISAQ